MRCDALMRRPVLCTSLEDNVSNAARRMRDSNVGFLPVCDADGRAIGILTDRDIAVRVCAEALSGDTHVVSIMTQGVISCAPEDDVSWAAALMASERKSRILILDAHEHPVGVISLADLAQHDPRGAAFAVRDVSAREVLSQRGERQGRP